MTRGGLRKVGWTWTRQGWKRVPRRLLAVKLVPMPKKRKTRKFRRISPAAPKVKSRPAPEPQNRQRAGQGGFPRLPSCTRPLPYTETG